MSEAIRGCITYSSGDRTVATTHLLVDEYATAQGCFSPGYHAASMSAAVTYTLMVLHLS